MQVIQIKGVKREQFGKKSAKDIRRENLIPCVLYGNGGETIHFSVETSEAKKLIYTPKSYIVEIDIEGTIEKGVMRETQFHPVKDYCLHIDFFRVVAGKPVAIEIPVSIVGNSEGVKAGGKLQVLRRKLAVSGLEEHLLDELVVDITTLGVGKTINVGDLSYEGLTLLQPASTGVVAVLATRQSGK
ncbi:MAG: 50S ribosomal protein L25 [Tidjanibacter sp.]|nr:50S ribosomal protein L25 [Tidjanibacter sp.]